VSDGIAERNPYVNLTACTENRQSCITWIAVGRLREEWPHAQSKLAGFAEEGRLLRCADALRKIDERIQPMMTSRAVVLGWIIRPRQPEGLPEQTS